MAFWLSCLGFGLALLGAILGGPSPFSLVIAAVSLAGLGVAIWLSVNDHRARQTVPLPTHPNYPLRALDQTEYAELLQADAAHERLFRARDGGSNRSQCGRCRRPAFETVVRHPIWDGPFDEAGSGKVDKRVFFWCLACDGPPPVQEGPAIRLPFLDHLPIRLLPELFERPVFRTLPMPVELYVPPPPAPAEVNRPGSPGNLGRFKDAAPTQETPS